MHRSGTSAVAGWLRALGVNLGPYLMAEDPFQPKGYFEHPEIVRIHDDLMAALNSSWDDPRPLPQGWERDRRVRPFRGQLMEIVRRDLMTQPLWGAKDPRLCRLLPLWCGMLGELGVETRAICVLRHPAEVAESLMVRNGFSAEKSGLLWLRYSIEATLHSQFVPRVTLRYSDLLRDWCAQANRIADALGVVWPSSSDEAAAAITDFLEPGLRHHERVYFDRFPPPFRRWIVLAYRALKAGDRPGDEATSILESVQRELASYDSYLAACWLERMRNVELGYRAELAQLRTLMEQSRAEAAQAHADSSRAQDDLARAREELARERSGLENAASELRQAQSALAASAEESAALRAELVQALDDLARLRAQLETSKTELERSSADARHAQQELDSVYRSRYWRITRPWRRLDDYLRSHRRRRRERRRRANALQ
jgi:hypothetical protein